MGMEVILHLSREGAAVEDGKEKGGGHSNCQPRIYSEYFLW